MIKTLSAFTLEVDEVDLAVSEILEQLDMPNNLLSHSVGTLTCSVDFLQTGVVKALCDKLPFDVVGTTTFGAGTNGAADLDILTLFVLTSDDVSFATVMTEPLADEQESHIKTAYDSAAAILPEKPSLLLVYVPMLNHVGGEYLVECINKVADGVPIFGTLTCDHNFDFHEACVIRNGEHARDRMAMILMSGPVNPRFFHVAVPEENFQKQQDVITASDGNFLKEVNNVKVVDYLKSIGLAPDGRLEGAKAVPIVVNFNDGTPPVTRGFYMITPEGYAVCGGKMPVNGTFSLGSMDYDDVLSSAIKQIEEITGAEDNHGMLMVSCIVRTFALDADPMAEAEVVRERLGDRVPYQLCYSGGEICPLPDGSKNLTNLFHTFSFVVCMF